VAQIELLDDELKAKLGLNGEISGFS